MDWTGSRMQVTGRIGRLTLTPQVAGPYRREEAGVVEFVSSYAVAALKRMKLERILIEDPTGETLGEVLPPTRKAPF